MAAKITFTTMSDLVKKAVEAEFPGTKVLNIWSQETDEFKAQWLCEVSSSLTPEGFEVVVTWMSDNSLIAERQ